MVSQMMFTIFKQFKRVIHTLPAISSNSYCINAKTIKNDVTLFIKVLGDWEEQC